MIVTGDLQPKKILEHLIKLLQMDVLHPEVVECFPLSRVATAHIRLEQGKVTGVRHLIYSLWLIEQQQQQQQQSRAKQQIITTTKSKKQLQFMGDTVDL